MAQRAPHIVGDVKPSGQTHDYLMASDVTINEGDIVLFSNPGTATGVGPGATTATAVFAGIALETKTNPSGGSERIKVDIGGAQAVVNVTDNLNTDKRNGGSAVIMAGPKSVTLGASGVRVCGKILEVITGGSGTSTALVKFNPMDHINTHS